MSVYLIESGGLYKIGVSADIVRRLKDISGMSPYPIMLVHTWESPKPFTLEKQLHAQCRACHVRGEWFSLNAEQIESLKKFSEGVTIKPFTDTSRKLYACLRCEWQWYARKSPQRCPSCAARTWDREPKKAGRRPRKPTPPPVP